MRRYANDFNNLENNFSRLSYMQHFGLPTRLLDVTTNALVALYFACQSHLDSEGHETDGIVTMFFLTRHKILMISHTIVVAVTPWKSYQH